MTSIHPTAVIAPHVQLGSDVKIGPFCVIEERVTIGPGCRLESHVVVKSDTELGANNYVGESAVLGGVPQHARCPSEIGKLVIGDGNTFREYVTIHRALSSGTVTQIQNGSLFMVNAHVGHDCVIGNQAIVANNVMLAGHVTIGDRAYISGSVGIHQFCRVGAFAMVGGLARITKDVPPFVTVDGETNRVVGLNLVGLRRAGFDLNAIRDLKTAYRIAYRSGLRWTEMLDTLAAQFPSGHGHELAEFMRSTERGCIPERAVPKAATLKLHQPIDEAVDEDRGVA
ncbi:MAG: acyl-ACP--UDP-N-acetylglucosamine O-acyltransferase [Planctomycetales bacterium]|nr:acyl-ACP--UDP-N-acetylglucosamine O-acyltransferase [Planctomycetales bacterium]